jgi:hypothetical protein
MKRLVLLVVLGSLAVLDAEAATVNVNCDQGQTINTALAQLKRHGPNSVNVRGTCTEWIDIRNFDQLTLKGRPGAVIALPSTPRPTPNTAVFQVFNSRDVVIRDLTLQQGLLIVNCGECRVEGSTVQRVTLVSGGANTLTFLRDVFQSNGSYAAFASYDNSHSNIGDCTLEPGDGGGAWWGIQMAAGSVVHIAGTTIRGFGNGIGVSTGADLQVFGSFPGSGPDRTVVIENNWYRGIDVSGGSTAGIGEFARIENNGDGLGGRVGVMVREGSYVGITGTASGARIAGTAGNGLAALSNSTVTVSAPIEIAGSQAQDVFCDPTAVINGGSNITGATKVTCPNLNSGMEYPLPSQ